MIDTPMVRSYSGNHLGNAAPEPQAADTEATPSRILVADSSGHADTYHVTINGEDFGQATMERTNVRRTADMIEHAIRDAGTLSLNCELDRIETRKFLNACAPLAEVKQFEQEKPWQWHRHKHWNQQARQHRARQKAKSKGRRRR